jgi:hypothetical protein
MEEMRISASSPLDFHVPLGESGTGSVLGATGQNSLVRLYAFERQHLAGQRLRLKLQEETPGDFAVDAQRVRLKVALDEGARPVAVAGQARTEARGPSGGRVALEELAYISQTRKLFMAGASAFFGEGKRAIPQFEIFDAFLSRLQVERNRQTIRDLSPEPTTEILRRGGEPARANAGRALGRLRTIFEELRSSVDRLLDQGVFRGHRVRVGDDSILSAAATEGIRAGSHDVEILRLADGQAVRSKAVANPGAALGLKGSFSLNGVEVPVLVGDGLFDIMQRINLGEDRDGNGVLDYAEDRDFDRILDTGEDRNGSRRLDREEDLNANGVLNAGEDFNANGRLDRSEDIDFDFALDGGTARHGVRARLLENRLVLEAAVERDRTIRFTDPDGILRELELLRKDIRGELELVSVVAVPAQAVLDIDEQERLADSNRLEGVLKGVVLDLRRRGRTTVEVERDLDGLLSAFRDFTDRFNRVIREVNDFLKQGALDGDPAAQRIRLGLDDAARPLDDLGLEAEAQGRASFHELQLRQKELDLQRGVEGVFDRARGVPQTTRGLDRIGILTADNGALALDEQRLRGELERDLPAVRRTLADAEEGILTSMRRFLDDILDPLTGVLGIREGALREIDLSDLVRTVRRFAEVFERGELQGQLLETLG